MRRERQRALFFPLFYFSTIIFAMNHSGHLEDGYQLISRDFILLELSANEITKLCHQEALMIYYVFW